jgi:hypothetical protein
MKIPSAKTLLALAAVAALAVPLAASQLSGGSNAANKTSVSGSTIEILSPSISAGFSSVESTVLDTSIKTTNPEDLIFSVTMECALWTQVETVGNDMAESTARVKVWVTVDGAAVPVASDDTQDVGKVVFCDRTHHQETSGFDDENATISQFLRTRSAHAFNWVLPNVGAGVHLIEVHAELSGDVSGMATSQAGVGHRTLIVEPTHLAQGASI